MIKNYITSRERRSLTYIHFLGGASIQSYNTNATAWALAEYLYRAGREYYMVPVGLAIGAALVIAHRIFVFVSPYSPLSSTTERYIQTYPHPKKL